MVCGLCKSDHQITMELTRYYKLPISVLVIGQILPIKYQLCTYLTLMVAVHTRYSVA